MKNLIIVLAIICSGCSSLSPPVSSDFKGVYKRTLIVDIKDTCYGVKGYFLTTSPKNDYICIEAGKEDLLIPILSHEMEHFWRRMLGLKQSHEVTVVYDDLIGQFVRKLNK